LFTPHGQNSQAEPDPCTHEQILSFSIQQTADQFQDFINQQNDQEDVKPTQLAAPDNGRRTVERPSGILRAVLKDPVSRVLLAEIHLAILIEIKEIIHTGIPPKQVGTLT
jgi:hypothetical protein